MVYALLVGANQAWQTSKQTPPYARECLSIHETKLKRKESNPISTPRPIFSSILKRVKGLSPFQMCYQSSSITNRITSNKFNIFPFPTYLKVSLVVARDWALILPLTCILMCRLICSMLWWEMDVISYRLFWAFLNKVNLHFPFSFFIHVSTHSSNRNPFSEKILARKLNLDCYQLKLLRFQFLLRRCNRWPYK